MGRKRRFIAALGSGYLSTAGTAAVNLLTFPLALYYLGAEWLGVVTGVLQTAAFLHLFELGMGPTIARLVVDYRAKNDAAGYASFFKCTLVIGAVQAAVIFSCAALLSEPIRQLLEIPGTFTAGFDRLFGIILVANALNCACVSFQQLLYAEHRNDLLNYNALIAILISGLALWIGFWSGWGIFSYALSAWVHTIVNQGLAVFQVVRLRLLPVFSAGRLRDAPLKEMLRFATNVWVVMIGNQLIAYVPIVIVSRSLGPGGLVVWKAGTQLLGLAYQVVARIPLAGEAAFWDMWARGEVDRLKPRFFQVVRMSAVAAALAGGGLIAINEPFITVWTRGQIAWPRSYDVGNAMWLLFTVISVGWNMLPGITLRLGYMRWFYFGEGLLLLIPVVFDWKVATLGAVPWILLGALMAGRMSYGFNRLRRDVSVEISTIGIEIGRILAVAIPVWTLAWAIGQIPHASSPYANLAVSAVLYSVVAMIAFWFGALPRNLRADAVARFRKLRFGRSE